MAPVIAEVALPAVDEPYRSVDAMVVVAAAEPVFGAGVALGL